MCVFGWIDNLFLALVFGIHARRYCCLVRTTQGFYEIFLRHMSLISAGPLKRCPYEPCSPPAGGNDCVTSVRFSRLILACAGRRSISKQHEEVPGMAFAKPSRQTIER